MGVRIGLENAENAKQPCVTQGKLRETLHNKKALSPIFATLIILSVVTVMFIPVFIWATGVTSQNQESWQLSGTIATERIVVEEVNLKYNQSTICSIYVRNIGKTTVMINDVLITAPSGEIFTYEEAKGECITINPTTGNPQDSINQGDMLEIRITNLKGLVPIVNDPANRDKLFTVKVFTTRGVGGEYQIVLEV